MFLSDALFVSGNELADKNGFALRPKRLARSERDDSNSVVQIRARFLGTRCVGGSIIGMGSL